MADLKPSCRPARRPRWKWLQRRDRVTRGRVRASAVREALVGVAVLALLASPFLLMHGQADVWLAMPQLLVAVGTVIAQVGGQYAWVGYILIAVGTVFGVVNAQDKARRARNSARDAYNDSLTDRMVTLMSAESPRQVIYGECTVAGSIVAVLTSGAKDEFKHVVVVWAMHECEALTGIYINGVEIGALDDQGNVTGGHWMVPGTETHNVTITLDAGGGANLPEAPSGVVALNWNAPPGSPVAFQQYFGATVTGTRVQVAAGDVAEWAGRTVSATYTVTTGTPYVRVLTYFGRPGQTADARTMAECPGEWTASDIGAGLCYSIFRFNLNSIELQSGPPQMAVRLRGRKVYDHRTGVTAYTSNNALCIADFLQAEWGKRALTTQLDWATVDAAANVCDEALVPSGLPRYTCNGAFRTDQDPDQTLDQLCQSMAGFATYQGGWSVHAGAYTAPVMDLTDADNRGSVEGVEAPTGMELFNGVRGQFFDPARYDQLTDYPPYQNAAFVAEDGGEKWTDQSLPFTDSAWRAHNLGRIQTERARGMQFTYPAKKRALRLRVGNRVRMSVPYLNMTLEIFRVVKRDYVAGAAVNLTLQQDDPSYYDEVDAPASLESPTASQHDPFHVAPPTGLIASSGTATLIKLGDGTILGRVLVEVDASTDALVTANGALQIEYRADDATAWQRAPEASGAGTMAYLLGLDEGRFYIVRARWRNGIGALSDWRSTSVFHQGKSEPPAAVEGFALLEIPGALKGTRTPSTEPDYKLTHYRYGAAFVGGTPLPGTSDAFGFVWPSPPVGEVKVWAVDEDTSGNLGEPVSAVIVITGVGQFSASSTLTVKANYVDFTTPNYNEAYLHGRDSSGAAADVPGTILVNGGVVVVPKGPLYTNLGPVAGYIVWESAGALISTGPGPVNYVMARRNAGAWEYDNNGSGWVPLAVTTTMFVIGTIETGAPDAGAPGAPPGITAATAWASASTLTALVAAADQAYAAAAAAQGTASSAATDAANALLALTNIASDSILSPSEKPSALLAYTVITAEQADIDAKATAYGITTEKTAYDAAIAALTAYLGTLPGWNTIPGGDVGIVGATWRSNFADVYAARQVLLNKIAAAAGLVAAWTGVAGRPKSFVARTQGNNGTPPAGWANGLFNAEGGGALFAPSRSYGVARFDGAGAIVSSNVFDVFGTPGQDAAMAATLNAIPDGAPLLVISFDEPQANRLSAALLAAMYRCGASPAVFGSPNFQYRSAYLLVAVAGCKAGNGAEVYAGSVAADPGAWCQLSFTIQNGVLSVSGMTRGAISLTDYGYTGALNATANAIVYSSSDPAPQPDGTLWNNGLLSYKRVGGAWVPDVGPLSINTGQINYAAAAEVLVFSDTGVGHSNLG